MLQRTGAQEWVWLELKETSDMNFRFVNKIEPASYATNLANGMHVYSIPHTVCGSELKFQCDLPEVVEYLSHFTPANSVITVSHKGFAGKTALKERWYGTEYNQRAYSAEQLALWEASMQSSAQWDDKLSLPLPNPFIPTDFALKAAAAVDAAYPVLVQHAGDAAAACEMLVEQVRPAAVHAAEAVTPPAPPTEAEEAGAEAEAAPADAAQDGDNAGDDQEEEPDEEDEAGGEAAGAAELPVLVGDRMLTWHLQDKTWQVPKLNVKVSLETLQASCSPLNVVLTELFAMCLKENLNEFSYYADCAGEFPNLPFDISSQMTSFLTHHALYCL
jgi:secreted Zn-dependent insulinase-like peptidase